MFKLIHFLLFGAIVFFDFKTTKSFCVMKHKSRFFLNLNFESKKQNKNISLLQYTKVGVLTVNKK